MRSSAYIVQLLGWIICTGELQELRKSGSGTEERPSPGKYSWGMLKEVEEIVDVHGGGCIEQLWEPHISSFSVGRFIFMIWYHSLLTNYQFPKSTFWIFEEPQVILVRTAASEIVRVSFECEELRRDYVMYSYWVETLMVIGWVTGSLSLVNEKPSVVLPTEKSLK